MKSIKLLTLILICVSIIFKSTIVADYEFSAFAEETTTEEPYKTLESKILESDRYCSSNSSAVTASLNINNKWFLPNEDILVSYTVSGEEEIQDFDYIATGLEVADIYVSETDSSTINIELDQIESVDENKLNLNLSLPNNNIDVSLFAYKNQYGTFVSQFSTENAFERYLEYAVTENILTPEEVEVEWYEYMSIETDISMNTVNSVNTDSSELGTICGYLKWEEDDGDIHPLRGVNVEVYCKSSNENVLIDHTCTTDEGYFTINIPANDNVYIKAYAGDGNVTVGSGIFGFPYVLNLNEYNFSKNEADTNNEIEDYDTYVNVEVGESIEYHSAPITMDTTTGQAFQIAQAAIAGRDYAKDMMGSEIADVTIIYPSLPIIGTCYIPVLSCIAIDAPDLSQTYTYYEAWDVIMHEYGHHIECILGIMFDPLGGHNIDDNHSNTKGTYWGTNLAWGEAWNTVFGLMAQDYLINEKKVLDKNIELVGDTYYTSQGNSKWKNIESTGITLGEACELSVMAVLWDLYDGNNDGTDEIELGREAYWELTTEALKFRFSDRANRFYELYADQPEMIRSFAKNLSYYQMAPSKPVITNLSGVSVNVAPILTWSKQGGSSKYPNNSFDIIVYDESYNEILRIDDIYDSEDSNTSYTYSIDNTAWKNALEGHGYGCGSDVELYITVSGSRVEPSVITGPYYSEYEELPITHEHTYSSVNAAMHNRYCSGCETTTVQPHRFVYSKFNDAMHFARCADCGYFQFMSHNMVYEQVDGRYHEHYCSYCSHSEGNSLHVLKSNGSTDRYQNCTACGALVDTGTNVFPILKAKIEEEEYTE